MNQNPLFVLNQTGYVLTYFVGVILVGDIILLRSIYATSAFGHVLDMFTLQDTACTPKCICWLDLIHSNTHNYQNRLHVQTGNVRSFSLTYESIPNDV